MLIHIDSSLIADARGQTHTAQRSRAVIERLLIAHEYNKHLVSFSRADYPDLQKMRSSLSEGARVALKDAHARLHESLALPRDIACYLRLGLGPAFDGRAIAEASCMVIRADAHRFADPERVGRAVLLGENNTDARLYRALGEAFLATRGFKQRISFELGGGGGSTLDKEFAERARDGRIVLAIADSDRRYPGASEDDTARSLRRAAVEKPAYQHAEVLDARAAENLVPPAMYREALSNDRVLYAKIAFLEALPQKLPQRLHGCLRHINIKSGLTREDAERKSDVEERRYWTEVFETARLEHIEGLGEKILAHLVEALGPNPNGKKIARLWSLNTDADLLKLGARIVAWGLARPGSLPTARVP